MMNANPEIAFIHDFVSNDEAENLIDKSKDSLKSTPFEYKVRKIYLREELTTYNFLLMLG